jgi:hypothetical protein
VAGEGSLIKGFLWVYHLNLPWPMVSEVGSPTHITPNDKECLVMDSASERKRLLVLIDMIVIVNLIRTAPSAA